MVVGILAAFVASCASTGIPAQELSGPKASVRAAEAVGAENHPQAALHLKMARDGIEEAERLIGNEENRQAEMALDRAEADAQLALALTEEQKVKAEAESARRKVEALKKGVSE
jgi:hypothetical protein